MGLGYPIASLAVGRDVESTFPLSCMSVHMPALSVLCPRTGGRTARTAPRARGARCPTLSPIVLFKGRDEDIDRHLRTSLWT